jgi:hypothetical protein
MKRSIFILAAFILISLQVSAQTTTQTGSFVNIECGDECIITLMSDGGKTIEVYDNYEWGGRNNYVINDFELKAGVTELHIEYVYKKIQIEDGDGGKMSVNTLVSVKTIGGKPYKPADPLEASYWGNLPQVKTIDPLNIKTLDKKQTKCDVVNVIDNDLVSFKKPGNTSPFYVYYEASNKFSDKLATGVVLQYRRTQLAGQEVYKDGKREGHWFAYFPEQLGGKIAWENFYKDGVLMWKKRYDVNGKVLEDWKKQ